MPALTASNDNDEPQGDPAGPSPSCFLDPSGGGRNVGRNISDAPIRLGSPGKSGVEEKARVIALSI